MRVDGEWHRTIGLSADGWSVSLIDQTVLPDRFQIIRLTDVEQMAEAIRVMRVRGAPLIGVAAAFGMALAMRQDPSDPGLERAARLLEATRPTAVNLRWALDHVGAILKPLPPADRAARAYQCAEQLADADVAACQQIGQHGATLLRSAWEAVGRTRPVQVMTHCNAGWLATVDWGTAMAPVYHAHDAGIPLHVWVSETRPRNQGLLTAWELGQHGVPYTVVADNAAGHLMRRGRVDLCIVGTDRVARNGDVANKIGTCLKALAAVDTGTPFYVAAPSPSIDWSAETGDEIPIEERSGAELGHGAVPVANPAFDITPARLVTALLTERGATEASAAGLARLFPERTA
ncbi:MAG: S-methyl-5-thioribose-1-phosphate isomerase [Gemmatimonadales bacterium]